MSVIKEGWVRVSGDDLSEFHRQLIQFIPKYASVAVSEGVLPKDRYVLPLEERMLLPKCADCGVGRACDEPFLTIGKPHTTDWLDISAVVHKQPFRKTVQPLRTLEPLSSPVLALVGKKGYHETIEWRPERYFRIERIDVSDSLNGTGTALNYMMMGCRIQPLPFTHLTPAMLTVEAMEFFREPERYRLDTVQPAFALYLMLTFIQDCEFRVQYHGKVI